MQLYYKLIEDCHNYQEQVATLATYVSHRFQSHYKILMVFPLSWDSEWVLYLHEVKLCLTSRGSWMITQFWPWLPRRLPIPLKNKCFRQVFGRELQVLDASSHKEHDPAKLVLLYQLWLQNPVLQSKRSDHFLVLTNTWIQRPCCSYKRFTFDWIIQLVGTSLFVSVREKGNSYWEFFVCCFYFFVHPTTSLDLSSAWVDSL